MMFPEQISLKKFDVILTTSLIKIRFITCYFSLHRPNTGHAFHRFLTCQVSGYFIIDKINVKIFVTVILH